MFKVTENYIFDRKFFINIWKFQALSVMKVRDLFMKRISMVHRLSYNRLATLLK